MPELEVGYPTLEAPVTLFLNPLAYRLALGPILLSSPRVHVTLELGLDRTRRVRMQREVYLRVFARGSCQGRLRLPRELLEFPLLLFR